MKINLFALQYNMAYRKISHILLASTALVVPVTGYAAPQDGTVTAGSASITQSGLTTAVHQSSNRAIIDWRSLDLNADETLRFYQPGSSSFTLNRINDTKASRIDGRIEANGRIMLLNQNGIVFGATSRIDVAGLIAATGRVDDAAFMSGATTLNITAGDHAGARIINNGHITARDAGLVGLVAPNVENNGIIEARLGKVTLAGAERVTLDLAGDNLISVDVDDQFNGKVVNTGSITADGGKITLTASRARNAVENSIVNTGTLRANSVGIQNGRIILSAGGTRKNHTSRGQSTVAAVKNAGTIVASSGKIELTGDSIQLTAASRIDASGINGGKGGTINIGGSYQGGNDRPTATWVSADSGSSTKSNGDADGDGGTIIFWADRLMEYRGSTEAEGGDASGDGGFVEVSGKNQLIFDGIVSTKSLHGKDGTLLLDPTNITISSGADQNVTAPSPYSPNADDVTSVLNITTLQNALASGNVIVQTRATGAQPGNITVANAIAWTSGNTLTLDAHNNIIVNAAISAGTGNLTLIAGSDVQFNANLSGSGILTLMPKSDATTIGVGASSVGIFNIATTDFTKMVDGWGSIVLGRTTSTAAMDLRAVTWLDNLTLQSGSGTITVNGIQNTGANNLTILTDGDITLGLSNALTGTGNLVISQVSAGTTIGLGDTGTINLNATDLARIKAGWISTTIGRTDGSGIINIGAATLNTLTNIQSGSGVINVNGILNAAGYALTLRTDADINLAVTNALTGTGALTIVQQSADTSMGLGDSQTGTLNLTTAEIARIKDGWSSTIFGRVDGTADMNIGALTWNDNLVLQTGSGVMNFNGTTAMGANTTTIRTDSTPVFSADITGTGQLAFVQASVNTSMGIGASEVGDLQIDAVMLAHFMGSRSLVFGRTDGTGAMNIGALTLTDSTTFRTGDGQMNINGNIAMGNNALVLQTNSDLNINGNLSGTGTSANISILLSDITDSIGVGDGMSGNLMLSNAELAKIVNGWKGIFIGSSTMTGAMNVASRSWVDPLTLRTGSGLMTISGANMAGNALTLTTDSQLDITGNLIGTGTLTLQPAAAATSIGVGTGQAGILALSDSDLGYIVDGWTTIVMGSTSVTGALNVGARTWNDGVSFRTGSGVLNINGTQNTQTNNLSFSTANLNINAALTGTGVLSFGGASNTTTIGIGTGQAGSLSLNDTELGLITDGWSSIVIGSTGMTGIMNVAGRTWTDSLDLRTDSGALNINGALNMGANNLTIRTNTNLTIGQILAGTGNLSILGSSGTTSMGIGDSQAGTLNLTNTELAFISDGWANLIFGSTGMTAAMNVGARTWTDNVSLRTAGLAASNFYLNINGVQTMGANNLTLMTNNDLVIGANLVGTGTLTISNASAATTIGIGVGTGAAGLIAMSDVELGRIVNGWSNIVIGSTNQTGATNVAAETWNDNLTLITGSGLLTIAGNQTMGANNLTLQTDSSLAITGNLTGSGQLLITTSAVGTSIGVGTGQTGTLALSDTEITKFIDGWAGITIGNAAGTGAINVSAKTWTDPLTLRSGSGLMTIAGVQTMGANNLTLQTNSSLALNANLVGTGALKIQGSAAATSYAIGDGQTGTITLTNTELAKIVDGWGSVTIGDASVFGAINIGAYTWLNPMTFITGGNVIINGIQNSSETSGTSLVYATLGGSFINNAGASAINPGGGRFLVYSASEAIDTLNGLMRPTILTNKSYGAYGPASVTETGNVFLYSGLIAKILYLVIDNAEKTYGDSVPTFTFSYIGGLQNGDLLNDAITGYTLTALGSTVLDDAGTVRSIGGSFTTALGYSVNVTNGNMTVIKADLIAEVDDESRAYGDANPTFSYTYTGFKNGDDETDINSNPSASTTANALSNVGTYTITAAGGSDNNYNLILSNGTLTVTKATLTATVQSATKVYGDANPTYNIVYTGFKNGDVVGGIDTLGHVSTAATTLSNVGTYALTGSGAIDNNYDFAYINSNMTITKAALVATADNKSRAYGDSNPALSVTYTGFKNTDTVSVIDTASNASTTANALTGVGTAAITLSAATDNNYTFSYVNGTLTINKATLTVTTDNKTRVYGDTNPALTLSYSGFKNGETASVINVGATAATTAIATTGVGNVAITSAGASDDNYDFTYVNGNLTITKAMLTATADNKTREYGETNPALTTTYTGFKNGETDNVINTAATAATTAVATTGVGNVAITTSGASDDNYDFTYVNGTLAITKATLTATADNKTRIYGNSNPALTVSYTGFKNGENSSVINTGATASTTAIGTTGVGNVAITTSGASDDNYDFTYVNGNLAITKAMLTATADNQTREYGDSNPALTTSYTGFKNGETASVIDTGATASTTAIGTTGVGNVAITTSGASDDNYDFTYVNGNLAITKAMLTATADNQTREYGDSNPALTTTYTGFKNGETDSVINTGATATTTANALTNVGNVAITTSGASDDNYNFTYVNGALAITKAMLTATADAKTRVYGNANPTLTTTYTGFKNGQTASVINTLATATTAADATTNVGSYTISTSGASDNNYDFTYADGLLDITKADLTIKADNKTRLYGDNNPALSVTYTGFKNGDDETDINGFPSLSTSANTFSDVGTYAIVLSGGIDNNYNLILQNGTVTVNKATLTVTADSDTRLYGDANPTLTYSYSGFKNSDTAVVINTQASIATTANALSNVGTYAITASGADDNNYTFAYVNGTLSITPATLTVTINDKTREFGLNNPAFNASYSGFKNGDTTSALNVGPSFSTVAGIGSDVGAYAITASGSDNNYNLNFVNGNLTITKAALTLQADNQIRLYGEANPPLTYTAVGLRAGNTAADAVTGVSVNTTANGASVLGSYAINISGGTSINYTLSYMNGALDVVGTMPAPPPAQPVTNIPSAANQPLTNNGSNMYTHTGDDSPYNMSLPYTFMTSPYKAGHEIDGMTAEEDGYITIYYYQDAFASQRHADPLVMIEPQLYYYYDDTHDEIASQ